jgi:MoaA/NifB/PqqE/SkfB family radical SAM enzyme
MIRARHVTMASRFLAHRFRELHPYEIQAVLLNACNLRCSYCRCPEIKTQLLTTAQWVDTIRGLGTLGALRIKFQGGEPTLRHDFTELCIEARRAGLLTAAITNGTRMADHPELLDALDEVVFSLDAVTPEIHDGLRGAGTHAQVVRAIGHARDRGLPTFVNMVVNRRNLAEVEPMLAFCEARGVQFNAQPVMFGVEFYDPAARSIALTTDEIRAMHHRLAALKRAGRGLMFSARTYEGVAEWPDYETATHASDGESPCMAGKFYVHIDANGDVQPCVQHGARLAPKNVVRDGLEAALRNAQRHDCGDCFTAYLVERKALFGLRPTAIMEMMRRG